MKSFFAFGTVLILACFFFFSSFMDHKSPKYVSLAAKITSKTASKLKKTEDLFLVGTGGGMMDDIKVMAMGFQYFHEIELKELRRKLVSVVQEYTKDINENKEVQPYLHERPFTAKNVEIRIWIYEPNRSDVPLDKIYHAAAIDGVLGYYIDDPERYSRIALCKETFEEAVAILSSETVLDENVKNN